MTFDLSVLCRTKPLALALQRHLCLYYTVMRKRRDLPAVNRGNYAVQVLLSVEEARRLERIRTSLGLRTWSEVFRHVLARHRIRTNEVQP